VFRSAFFESVSNQPLFNEICRISQTQRAQFEQAFESLIQAIQQALAPEQQDYLLSDVIHERLLPAANPTLPIIFESKLISLQSLLVDLACLNSFIHTFCSTTRPLFADQGLYSHAKQFRGLVRALSTSIKDKAL